MEPEALIKHNKQDYQLNINEEDPNKKSKDTQQYQKSNNQLSNFQHRLSFNLNNINDTSQKRDFTRISLLNPENLVSNSKIYQQYIKNYQNLTSLYYIEYVKNDEFQFIICDIKGKKEIKQTIDENQAKLDFGTCIAPLPNGNLFCYGNLFCRNYGWAYLFDSDFNVHELPPGRYCSYSSAIYYNRSVYCFGGNENYRHKDDIRYSKRFDLDLYHWTRTSPLPEPADNCSSVVFNGNILISKPWNINLWLYSIDIDSFSIIPYKFDSLCKIMTNGGERLYLIECDNHHWFIYESGIEDEFIWKLVGYLENIITSHGRAKSCLYNKEKERLYIFSLRIKDNSDDAQRLYLKFNLNGNVLKKKRKCRIF